MPTDIRFESKNLCVLCISGILTHAEFDESQQSVARQIEAGVHPRMLVILINFEGWEAGANWSDAGFILSHGAKIPKIAIVGDPQWEAQALMFAGAGLRTGSVKFFPTARLAEARTWAAS